MLIGRILKKKIIAIETSKNAQAELINRSVRRLAMYKWLYTWFGWL